jgi:hypothetical protein
MVGLRFHWTTKQEVERELQQFLDEAVDIGVARNVG